MRCHRLFRPVRNQHRVSVIQRPWLRHSCRIAKLLCKAQSTPKLCLYRSCLFMVSANLAFTTEILQKLMNDNPLPVYPNHISPLWLSEAQCTECGRHIWIRDMQFLESESFVLWTDFVVGILSALLPSNKHTFFVHLGGTVLKSHPPCD